jgi:hypothetical protein
MAGYTDKDEQQLRDFNDRSKRAGPIGKVAIAVFPPAQDKAMFPSDRGAVQAAPTPQPAAPMGSQNVLDRRMKEADAYADGGQIGSYPKKPNPPVQPFGKNPGAKPC